jgi:hypothetical protein
MKIALSLILFAIMGATAQAQTSKALLLFGGEDHDTFLGCLNCTDTSVSSVCNDVGKYGSDIATDSIWNDIGKFGFDISQYSPWNDLSSKAPIIVDKDGTSYGYFSANDLHHDRTRVRWLLDVLDVYQKHNDLTAARKAMCSS